MIAKDCSRKYRIAVDSIGFPGIAKDCLDSIGLSGIVQDCS